MSSLLNPLNAPARLNRIVEAALTPIIVRHQSKVTNRISSSSALPSTETLHRKRLSRPVRPAFLNRPFCGLIYPRDGLKMQVQWDVRARPQGSLSARGPLCDWSSPRLTEIFMSVLVPDK